MRRILVGAGLAAPSPGLAYHDTLGVPAGGGIPLEAVLPIAAAVLIGGIALAIWGRAPGKKAKRKKPAPSPGHKTKKAKRGG
jgi:hypothetical protein